MKLSQEILRRFQIVRRRAAQKMTEPTAMTLATVDRQSRPSARVVLLKGVDEQGFVFYTNFHSQKGQELEGNRWAALCFFWDSLEDQVRVEGRVKKVSSREADLYWKTRPRDSQIGAWASRQSAELKNRSELLSRVAQFSRKFKGSPIPRPSYWNGFRVIPSKIEFWKRMPFRLHERVVYLNKGGRWKKTLLFP